MTRVPGPQFIHESYRFQCFYRYTVNFFFTVPRLVYHVFTLIRVKRDKERD